MLYLKRLTLSRFKSFKHAELEFSKGFTCVVGPNGSGKSNICDALLFGLGETAIHRLRVDKLEQLVSIESSKKRSEVAKAYVKIELAGDEDVEVIRVARADGKSLYKINGQKYSRAEAVEVLKKYKFNINETNTITQGEINKLMSLNAKERRELIDIASGIREFEEKKKEAIRELDKVNSKIGEAQIMLNERSGFLKELEKEKAAAEKYVEMSSKLKSLKYSVLLARAKDAQGSFDSYSRMLGDHTAKRQKMSAELEKGNAKLRDLTSSRQKLTKDLSGSSVSIGEITKKTEGIQRELTTIEVGMVNSTKTVNDGKVTLATSEEQIDSVKKKIKSNSAEISSLTPKMESLEKIAKKQAYSGEYQEQLDSKISKANSSIEQFQARLNTIAESISTQSDEVSGLKGSISELKKRSESISIEEKDEAANLAAAKKELDSLQNELSSASSRVKTHEKRTADLQMEMSKLDESIILIREQLAQSSRESGSIARIRGAFEGTPGFFGTVSQLCTYPVQHAGAVEASAGGRMEYVVVETIEKASEIISYMKKNNAGRATFIPLNDVQSSTTNPAPKGSTAVIEVVEFDKKFKRVFDYVFSNTYIISNIDDSKKLGLGSRRYVTNDGELVEQSGVVSGGALRKRQTSAAVLDSQLRDANSRKTKLGAELKSAEDTLFKARKEQASVEINMSGKLAVSSTIQSRLAAIKKELSATSDLMKDEAARLSKAEKSLKDMGSEREQTSKSLESARAESKSLYEESIKLSKAAAGSASERKMIEESRKELEGLKIRNAELSTENQMLAQKEKELDQLISSTKKQVSSLSEELKENEKRKVVLKKALASLESEMKNSSEISGKVFAQLQTIDNESEKIGKEVGRMSAEIENVDRQMNECKIQIGQLNVRIGDVKAELAAYGESVPVIQGKAEALDREAEVISSKITDLGNVNLKAPELYDQRKKDVDSAWGRVTTLEDEKNAVLKMIDEIDSRKFKVFSDTFDAVNKNFTKIYNYVFPWKAAIELEDPKDPFNSGLSIKIDTGTSKKTLNSLSGGEKSLTMLLLLFSIHTYNPSSIYIFDEIDAALDKENSKKLSQLIKQLGSSSQFIVVSHNDSLIVSADVAIGVTKLKDESRAIGIEVSKIITPKSG